MPEAAEPIVWSCGDILAPFRWTRGAVVQVAPDLFEPEVRGKFRDEVFAIMALCPELHFELRTAHPHTYQEFVRLIAEDRTEYLAWRVSAATILRKLDRDHEATGPGPEWPLENVVLVGEGSADA
ncbi:DUF5131 domain-containing protein [Mesorhizobium sp.]|uniref:DUF5131 domain-containing protein n=1 Tax=Mesorhizobium sp. TaxID=1871066 RepID=UPI000FE6D1E5|nr:DUF5131 domain-containing protein [Mesorhizobium sp.]RWA84892.1 MAG: DUF5131 domain-containing protein [Mesorhizobium sp.]